MPVRSYKVRFYPTKAQERTLAQWFDQSRFAWNHALAERTRAWEERRETRTSVGTAKNVVAMKRDANLAWRRSVPCAIHTQAMRNLDQAFKAIRKGRARHPRFKAKRRSPRVDFDVRHAGKARAWSEGTLVLPKIGRCKLRGRALPAAMLKLVTVKHDPAGRYWVSFNIEEALPEAPPPVHGSVGVNVGARRQATLSTGETMFDTQ